MGRNEQAREKAGVKARGRTVGGRRVVSSAQSRWLADSYRKVHPLIGELQRHVVTERELLDALRPTGIIHPSQACKADWCPRASWYEITGADPLPENLSHRMASIFAEGTEIHTKYQRWFRDMGVLYGWWVCLVCNYQWWAQSPERCEFCQSEYLRYAEVPIADEDLMLAGSGDALVMLTEQLRLIEIKSIGLRSIELEYPKLYRPYKDGIIGLDELWARIKGPFPVHIRQATLYLHVLREAMSFDVDEIIFLYEFKANQAVKAFTIGYQPEAIAHVLRGARTIVTAVEQGRSVRRPEWAEPKAKPCQACRFRHHCWDGFNDE